MMNWDFSNRFREKIIKVNKFIYLFYLYKNKIINSINNIFYNIIALGEISRFDPSKVKDNYFKYLVYVNITVNVRKYILL